MKVSISAVWDRTTEFLSANIGAAVTIAALTLYLPGLAQQVLLPLSGGGGGGGRLGLGVASLLLSIVNLFGQTAVIALVLDPAAGSGGAFARAAARLPAMLAVAVTLFLVSLALFLPPVTLMAMNGFDVATLSAGTVSGLSPGVALLIALYALVLLPVVLWAGARLAIAGGVVVAERRGLGALGRSFALTRGSAGRIFGTMLLFLVVATVAVLAGRLVFGSILLFALGGGPTGAAGIGTAMIVGVISTAATVVINTFLAMLYLVLRERAEAVPTAA